MVHVGQVDYDDSAVVSLLGTAANKSNVHSFARLNLTALFGGPTIAAFTKQPPKFYNYYYSEPELPNETGDILPEITPDDHSMDTVARRKWNGRKWWPGCYKNDNQLHEITLGVFGDYQMFKDHGGQAAQKLEAEVVKASFVYEGQLNIKLTINKMTIQETSRGLPSGCQGVGKLQWISNLLDALTNLQKSKAVAHHVFSGCGKFFRGGTNGYAWIGVLCGRKNTAANLYQGEKTWLTFAHELGHNINAQHSFENGQGRTGGIMDYGQPKINGEVQFNTALRKREICGHLNNREGSCFGTATPLATPVPTPLATPAPCADTLNWSNGYHGCEIYKGSWCQDGSFRGLGYFHNYPDRNCCACGKGERGSASVIQQSSERSHRSTSRLGRHHDPARTFLGL
jgi:hypothetical protein